MTGPRRVVKGSSTQAWASSCGQVIQTCAFGLSLMETNHCTTDSDHLDVTVITQAKKRYKYSFSHKNCSFSVL